LSLPDQKSKGIEVIAGPKTKGVIITANKKVMVSKSMMTLSLSSSHGEVKKVY
jgi:hypothetical protein